MNTVITYDIVKNRTRTRFHKFLKEMGLPSQYSVFECRLDDHELSMIRNYCRDNLNLKEDSVRIYRVCKICRKKALLQGKGLHFPTLDWTIL